ncbi:antirestriction protein ArdA [Enterocloster clostridioformis]|uniref:antirestriction protein ArdA n=1 Tax=Enterocloster clostridioformis TaxID=1531 RepID=UPI00156EFF9B|nr:antirestriction protein ArdA [Enterocloster clostridioformis]NSJ57191.1 DUF4316 domain-containing protein [Enterocloster clostridioformis]
MAYSYDHDCPFEAFITNLGKYNEGELVGEWVKFPTTPEKLQEVFERIGIGSQDEFGSVYEEWFITDYDCYVDGLYDKLGEYESLDELNYLASKLEELGDAEYEHFQAAMQISDYTGSIKDLINLTDNLDKYDVLSGIEDYDDLGRYYIEELGTMVVPEHLQNYINYEAYGRDIALDEISDFTDYGYVYDNQSRFVEYYDGDRENIPEEYRVMVSPEEPELDYEEQQETETAMLEDAMSMAFEVDKVFQAAQPTSPQDYLEALDFHERQEEIVGCLIKGDYGEIRDRLSQIAKEQGEYSQTAENLLKEISAFDDKYIGMDDRMLIASMELAADIDQFFRSFDVEYPAMFPDETEQQIVLHEHLYKQDTSAIKTGLLNMGREKDLTEETAPLINRLTDYEKEFGINTYTVYQIKSGEDYREYRFEGSDYLEKAGLSVNRENYEPVYAAPLTPGDTLESIYTDLNLYRPDNFHGNSLSVSDVVVFQEYGKETAHFCDRIGYKEVPEFLEQENYLKNAEIALEDDYGMIDGIINNGERKTDKEVQTDKPSVLGQLSQAKKECAERKPPETGKLGKEEPEL